MDRADGRRDGEYVEMGRWIVTEVRSLGKFNSFLHFLTTGFFHPEFVFHPPSPHLEFWLHNEPDNWTGQNVEGEDCVRLGEKGATTRNLRYWTDKSCTVPHKSICEKSLEKCTCF